MFWWVPAPAVLRITTVQQEKMHILQRKNLISASPGIIHNHLSELVCCITSGEGRTCRRRALVPGSIRAGLLLKPFPEVL